MLPRRTKRGVEARMRVVIEGASGYAGMELTRWLARHPAARLVGLTSGRWEGSTAHRMTGVGGATGSLVYARESEEETDIVFLATPAEASRDLARRWLERGARVIDLSDAFRADSDAVYGLTEHARDALPGARLVATPGCYPTATQLAVLPLIHAGLGAEGAGLVDAKSGVSGAGRRLDDSLLFNELDGNHHPYNVGIHRHEPEIERGLERPVLFTPHLLPTLRGLLSTVHVPVRDGVDGEAVQRALEEAYASESLVDVVAPDRAVGIRTVGQTPMCRVACAPVVKGGFARVFGAIDNLLKGAATQAIQNMNCVMGRPETEGLVP